MPHIVDSIQPETLPGRLETTIATGNAKTTVTRAATTETPTDRIASSPRGPMVWPASTPRAMDSDITMSGRTRVITAYPESMVTATTRPAARGRIIARARRGRRPCSEARAR